MIEAQHNCCLGCAVANHVRLIVYKTGWAATSATSTSILNIGKWQYYSRLMRATLCRFAHVEAGMNICRLVRMAVKKQMHDPLQGPTFSLDHTSIRKHNSKRIQSSKDQVAAIDIQHFKHYWEYQTYHQ